MCSHRLNVLDIFEGWHQCKKHHTPEELAAVKLATLKSVQKDTYQEKYVALQENRVVLKSSAVPNLDLFMCDGLLQTGWHLRHADSPEVKNSSFWTLECVDLMQQRWHSSEQAVGCTFSHAWVPGLCNVCISTCIIIHIYNNNIYMYKS